LVHAPVDGSQISAARAGALEFALVSSLPLLPPVARTRPSGRIVKLWCLRARFIDPVLFQTGEPAVRSMISAVFVGETADPLP